MFKKAVALNDAFQDFLISREAILVSPGTLRLYNFTARKFIEWINVDYPNEILPMHVRTYLAELRKRELSDSYIHGHARAIKTMLRFFHIEGYMSEPIKFDMPSVEKKRLPILSIEELKKVIEACKNCRDLAIILLLADSGIRRAELCSLNWEDVELSQGVIRVRKGKGKKYRTVIIGIRSRNVLKEYSESINSSFGEPVIQTNAGKRLTPMGLRSVLVRLSNRIGIQVTPHALRRTFATLSLRAGMNLIHLQNLLGHSTLEMTRQYIQMLDEDLIKAHNSYGPIDNLVQNY